MIEPSSFFELFLDSVPFRMLVVHSRFPALVSKMRSELSATTSEPVVEFAFAVLSFRVLGAGPGHAGEHSGRQERGYGEPSCGGGQLHLRVLLLWWVLLVGLLVRCPLRRTSSVAVATEPWPDAGEKLTRNFSLSLCLWRKSRFSLAVSETFSVYVAGPGGTDLGAFRPVPEATIFPFAGATTETAAVVPLTLPLTEALTACVPSTTVTGFVERTAHVAATEARFAGVGR